MWLDRNELLYDLLTRDALLINDGQIYPLDGPFESREQAEAAAIAVVGRMASDFTDTTSAAARD